MYDVNPLGPIMHLRELDRQATPQLRPFRLEGKSMPILTSFRATMIAVLRRFYSVAHLGDWLDVLRQFQVRSASRDARRTWWKRELLRVGD